MNNKDNTIVKFTDNILIILVIISLSCIFVEDFLKFLDAGDMIKYIQLICLLFDVIFVFEFILRSLIYFLKEETKAYIFHKRGWIDFIASMPVLIFISIPVFFHNFLDISIPLLTYAVPNSLLMLRFLRILKLVKAVKYKKSALFQKQISSISSIITVSIIVFLSGVYFLQESKLLFVTYTDIRQNSFINLVYFSMILFIITCIALFYGRQFKIFIFHPISEIIRGFEEIYYTKEVKIPKNYNEDEISILAENFNRRWLPAKLRKLKEIKSRGITVVNTSKKGSMK